MMLDACLYSVNVTVCMVLIYISYPVFILKIMHVCSLQQKISELEIFPFRLLNPFWDKDTDKHTDIWNCMTIRERQKNRLTHIDIRKYCIDQLEGQQYINVACIVDSLYHISCFVFLYESSFKNNFLRMFLYYFILIGNIRS